MGSCFAFEFSDGSWRIFEDKTSGARTERNGLNRALEQLRDGDTLVVWRLDRLGRSLKDLIARAEALVEETISAGLDDLDARLARVGYSPKALADLTDARLPEIRRFLKGKLDAERTDELSTLLRKAGLPK